MDHFTFIFFPRHDADHLVGDNACMLLTHVNMRTFIRINYFMFQFVAHKVFQNIPFLFYFSENAKCTQHVPSLHHDYKSV